MLQYDDRQRHLDHSATDDLFASGTLGKTLKLRQENT